MAGVMDFYLAIGFEKAAYQCGVLASQRTLAENAIRLSYHLSERQPESGESTKQGMKLSHQHGCRYPLAGNIAEYKEQMSIEGN
jgi:hypothetical protein